jgi:heme-degrading monooxygenase HmoA
VTDSSVVRIYRFRPAQQDAPIDAVLRDELLPDALVLPGLLDAFVGRRGHAAGDHRVIVSVWQSLGAMESALGDGSPMAPLRNLDAGELEEVCVEVLPLAVVLRMDRPDPPCLLRVYRGETRPGELDAYVEEARAGTLMDAESNMGLVSLYLATAPPSRFVTVSAWTSWAAVEQATGSNVKRPDSTRNARRLVTGTVDHYEILPETARPPARVPIGAAVA